MTPDPLDSQQGDEIAPFLAVASQGSFVAAGDAHLDVSIIADDSEPVVDIIEQRYDGRGLFSAQSGTTSQ